LLQADTIAWVIQSFIPDPRRVHVRLRKSIKNTSDAGGRMMRGILSILIALCALAPIGARAEISDDVVRIGVLTDLSSVYSGNTGPGSVEAARMAIEDFGGKVLGKPIELISADHQNKPDIGTALARRWFDEQKVDAIVDVPVSSIALAIQNLARERHKMLLISGAGSSEITNAACSPTTFQWTYDSFGQSKVVADAIFKQGLNSWFFITRSARRSNRTPPRSSAGSAPLSLAVSVTR
jgi:branched-chain amino acid transport system substrate-binding protein